MSSRRFEHDSPELGAFPPNRKDEHPNFTITIKHIPAHLSRQSIIDFASQFGTIACEPHITQATERLQKMSFVTFHEPNVIERCMKAGKHKWKIQGYSVTLQRYLPPGRTFDRSFHLLLFFDDDQAKTALKEDEICEYFEMYYGQIKTFSWTSNEVALVEFYDYDSVDQAIVCTLRHSIKGFSFRLEKVISSVVRAAHEEQIANHNLVHCVHVQNIPPGVNSEKLAELFNSHVWDILIRQGENPDTDFCEAWILNIPLLSHAIELAGKVKDINGIPIQCEAQREPLNDWTLCAGNRDGHCRHGDHCNYRHVMCSTGDQCIDENCLFSHSVQRLTQPNTRKQPVAPIDQQYRIRLDGLPVNMTVVQLLSELKNQPIKLEKYIERPDVPSDATVRHFYLIRQQSERLTRKRIFHWHNYPIRLDYKVKCQLEYDRISIDSTRDGTLNHLRLRKFFEPLSPGENPIDGMPSEWVWTNRLIGRMSDKAYLVYPADVNDIRLGVMKIYHAQRPSQVKLIKTEVSILQKIQNVPGVASIYDTNVSDTIKDAKQPFWIIMPLISNVNLEEFIEHYPRRLTFEHALILTRQLLEIVQRCHHRGVYHRNLHPNNILVQYSFDQASAKDVRLVLINFSAASMNDLTRTSDLAQNKMREDLSSDLMGIGRILLWLLTDQWWESLQSMKSSYNNNRYYSSIFNKLSIAKNDQTMQNEIMNLFHCAFDAHDQRWSTDDFQKQLDIITNLFIEKQAKQLDALFPSSSVAIISSLSDSYARAVSLIAQLKQGFGEKYCGCIKWSTEHNRWNVSQIDQEVKNTDRFTYHYQNKSYELIAVCSAKIHVNQMVISVGVGIPLSNQTIDMKRIFDVTSLTFDTEVSKDYEDEMKQLIHKQLSNDLILMKK